MCSEIKPTPTKSPLEPEPSSSGGGRGQGATATTLTTHTLPVPLPYPLPAATRSPAALYPPGQDHMGSPEETRQGVQETQGSATGQGRPRSPNLAQSAEGGKGNDTRETIIVVVRSPCQEKYPADAHTGVHKSVLGSANPAWTRSVHLDALGQMHRQQPVSGTADPRSSQTGQVIQGLR